MRCGLIGKKLGHSWSKPIHEALGNYEYRLFELTEPQLHPFLTARDFDGLNVTIPYKRDVMAYCDEIEEAAQAIGAVNTLVNRGGKLRGYNTDFFGLLHALAAGGITLAGKRVLVLGSGGTAHTVRAVAAHQGAARVYTASRSPGPGEISYGESKNLRGIDILVNATPVGMYPNGHARPVDLENYPHCAGVVDMIYNPLQTRLLQQARDRGIPGINGLHMLVAQAARAAELFMDRPISPHRIDALYRRMLGDMTNIVLVGMPASGKTSVGMLLARELNRPLVDTDDCIGQRAGCSIPEIFSKQGEQAFRQLETLCVEEAASQTGRVIATGGGAVLNPENIAALRQNGLLFFLDRRPETLEWGGGRPLSADREAVMALYRQRYPLYTACADAAIPNDGTPEGAAECVKERFYEMLGAQRPQPEPAGS